MRVLMCGKVVSNYMIYFRSPNVAKETKEREEGSFQREETGTQRSRHYA